MLNTPVDFKEQMAEARRTQILMGAAKVFSEKGFHKATTREIAQTAGVSEGTIYNYFENKRELLLAMIELLAAQSLKGLIIHQPPTDPREFISLVLHDRYRLIQERGHLFVPLIAGMFSDVELREEVYRKIAMPTAGLLEQYIQANIDTGLFRPVNSMIITRMFVGAIIVNFAMKLGGLDPRYETISADALIEELVSLFLATLLKPQPTDNDEQ